MTIDKLKRKYENKKPSGKMKNETETAKIGTPDDWPAHAARSIPALDDGNNSDQGSTRGFDHWQDSAPVMRMSAYLRANAAAGIRICKSDGQPSLVFDPPLGLADMQTDRWKVALDAIDLAQAAAHDLKILLLNGLISLPEHVEVQTMVVNEKPNVVTPGLQHTILKTSNHFVDQINEKLFS